MSIRARYIFTCPSCGQRAGTDIPSAVLVCTHGGSSHKTHPHRVMQLAERKE